MPAQLLAEGPTEGSLEQPLNTKDELPEKETEERRSNKIGQGSNRMERGQVASQNGNKKPIEASKRSTNQVEKRENRKQKGRKDGMEINENAQTRRQQAEGRQDEGKSSRRTYRTFRCCSCIQLRRLQNAAKPEAQRSIQKIIEEK